MSSHEEQEIDRRGGARRPEPEGSGGAAGQPPVSTRFAFAGAFGAAVLASACCWLPAAALALGVSAGAVGAFRDRWRPLFLGIAALSIGYAFWKGPRRRWPLYAAGAALVAALAFLPELEGLAAGAGPAAGAATSQPASRPAAGLVPAGLPAPNACASCAEGQPPAGGNEKQ